LTIDKHTKHLKARVLCDSATAATNSRRTGRKFYKV